MKKLLILMTALLCGSTLMTGQNMIDISAGLSNSDVGFVNVAYRRQISEKFRLGIEIQTGAIDYRFIGAKVVDEGSVTAVNIPLTARVFQDDRLRLDFYSRVGLRFQSVSSEYADEQELEDNTSLAYLFEPGLIVSFPLSEKLNLQSGFTLPILIESAPEGLFENNVSNLFVTAGYQASSKSIVFVKANTGPAAGADGDSQKYTWSFQAGLRFSIAGILDKNSMIIDPSF